MTAAAGYPPKTRLARDRSTGLASVAPLGVIGMYFLLLPLLLRLAVDMGIAAQPQHTARC